MLSEANVEPYLPNAWTEEETSVLAHLVGMYGATHWAIISAGVDTKSETQVRKILGKFSCFCENAFCVQYVEGVWSPGRRSISVGMVVL